MNGSFNTYRALSVRRLCRRISCTVVLSRLSCPFSRRLLMYINRVCLVAFRNPQNATGNSCCLQSVDKPSVCTVAYTYLSVLGYTLSFRASWWPPNSVDVNVSCGGRSKGAVSVDKLKFHGSSFLVHSILVRHARFPRDMLATSSRGCHEDATRKLLPWNLSYSLQHSLYMHRLRWSNAVRFKVDAFASKYGFSESQLFSISHIN